MWKRICCRGNKELNSCKYRSFSIIIVFIIFSMWDTEALTEYRQLHNQKVSLLDATKQNHQVRSIELPKWIEIRMIHS